MRDPTAPYALLPRLCPIVVAAKIAGLSAQTFRERFIKTGAVGTEDGRVVLSSLAHHLGRLIHMHEYLAANRALDLRRESQREYATRQRATVWRGRIAS